MPDELVIAGPEELGHDSLDEELWEVEGEEDEEQVTRKRRRRSDADQPRMWDRDINIIKWVGEMGAASADNLRELAGREAAGQTKQKGLLSKTRIRHLIEEHWVKGKMFYTDNMMGRRWVWPTRRALQRVGLPFSTHRPADINLNHIHHCNRIRLYLEKLYWSQGLTGIWESERMIELSKKEWKAKQKADPIISIPAQYKTWHMPDAIFTYQNKKDQNYDYWAFVEVEVSLKRPEKLNDIVYNLAVYGATIWYYVDMDPKKGIFDGLKDALETLTGRDERLRSKFWIYDLAEPTKLVYRYVKPKEQSG